MRFFALAAALLATLASAQTPLPQQAREDADAAIVTARSLAPSLKWSYEAGTLLDGIAAHYAVTHRAADLELIRTTVDQWVAADGTINVGGKPFDPALHTLDNLEPGRICLWLFEQTRDDRYRKAADTVFAQFDTQPRTPSGGFWHKQIYPNQMWLDGAYMAEPFRAAYTVRFHSGRDLPDVAKQFELMFDHMRDPANGLLRHGWDESKQMPWADKQTGLSPESWARAMGWYMVALADTLPYFPRTSTEYKQLRADFEQLAKTIAAAQDPGTGLWHDVLSKPDAPGNFLESSASAMFVYALAKGVRDQDLPHGMLGAAMVGFAGLQRRFVTLNADGTLTLHGTVKVSGLGGKPYRAGDYDYYVHEAVGDNDLKGLGAFLMAASEIERFLPVSVPPPPPRPAARGGASTTP